MWHIRKLVTKQWQMQQHGAVVASFWVREGSLGQLYTMWILLPNTLVYSKDPSDGEQSQAKRLGASDV